MMMKIKTLEVNRMKKKMKLQVNVNNSFHIRRGVTTHSRLANFREFYSFVSSLEPLRVEQALKDPDWVIAMQEELNNFTRNEVWSLVERPKQNVIGTKWSFATSKMRMVC